MRRHTVNNKGRTAKSIMCVCVLLRTICVAPSQGFPLKYSLRDGGTCVLSYILNKFQAATTTCVQGVWSGTTVSKPRCYFVMQLATCAIVFAAFSRLRPSRPGVRTQAGRNIPDPSISAPIPTHPPVQWVPGVVLAAHTLLVPAWHIRSFTFTRLMEQ